MRPFVRAINLNACAQRVEVDNRMSLHYYYRIADNLLKQASIYREEKNLIDLYIILLRFSSLMCETIPSHRDYQTLLPKEKAIFRKKLLDVMNELESLKPSVQRQVDELNKAHFQSDMQEINFYGTAPAKKQIFPSLCIEQAPTRSTSQLSRKPSNERNLVVSSDRMQKERQFQRQSLSLVQPKEETLSRHSILGPNGLRGQWTGPVTGIRVQYPDNAELIQSGITGVNQDEQYGAITSNEGDSRKSSYDLESVLSLDDGRWSIPVEKSGSLATNVAQEGSVQLNIRQPSPPAVLAELQPEVHTISPSNVADPRPGPPKHASDGMPDSKEYQDLHVPVKMMECFLRLAETNTVKNLETCGVLAGSLKNRMFFVTTLIIPKQESTSDSARPLNSLEKSVVAYGSNYMDMKHGKAFLHLHWREPLALCQTKDEEEIFDVQDKRSLFPLGWIHTHPTQTCFMSSIDLHTHYSYQIMLPEAIAIVMAPTDTSRTHGIFHLTDPGGVSVIRHCQERGFHPHEQPPDGRPIYEHCSHVYMNPNLKFDVVDLRNS